MRIIGEDVRPGLFHADFYINPKEDAANNFARGHYIGIEKMKIVNDPLRKMVDNSENIRGFIVM